MNDVTDTQIRTATPADAATVASLHAASWRRHYRGAYADAYLDGDVVSDRLAVWTQRLAMEGTLTLLAEHSAPSATEPLGFLHIVFDDDPTWGSLIDNLHVTPDRQRSGVGRSLLTLAARAATRQATHAGLYLWVLEQNDAAQRFYRAMGGSIVGKGVVSDPGGVPGRLAGRPVKLRCAWPDVRAVTGAART